MENLTQAMIDFVFFMDWNYIVMLYQNNNYGLSAAQHTKMQIQKRNICIYDDMICMELGSSIGRYARYIRK